MFSGNWVKWASHSSKTTENAVNDKILTFKQNSEFCKTCICHGELENFPIFKEPYAEIGREINISDSLNIYIIKCITSVMCKEIN